MQAMNRLVLTAVCLSILTFPGLALAQAAGCCDTATGCFATDSEGLCDRCDGRHYQLGFCDENGTCQPTAPDTVAWELPTTHEEFEARLMANKDIIIINLCKILEVPKPRAVQPLVDQQPLFTSEIEKTAGPSIDPAE